MKTTEVKYTRRMPREEYGFEEVTVTAAMDEDDVTAECLQQLKADVEGSLNGETPADDETPPPKKSRKGKKKPADDEEEENEEEENEEEEGGDTDEEENEEEENNEEDDEEKGPKKGKKSVRKKAATYSRTNEIHKKIFGEFLTKCDPKWKTTPKGKAKAKKISEQMEGEEFIDDAGETVPAFLIAVRKAYKGK